MGVYYEGCTYDTVTIKVGVVSFFVRQQRRSAVQFDRRSSYMSARTQQNRHALLCHGMRSCAMTQALIHIFLIIMCLIIKEA